MFSLFTVLGARAIIITGRSVTTLSSGVWPHVGAPPLVQSDPPTPSHKRTSKAGGRVIVGRLSA